MTSLELTITNHLRTYHKGKANAIHFKDLARVLDINERELRSIVAELVTSGQACICSTSSNGYFYKSNNDELQHTYKELRSRGLKDLMRARGLLRADIKENQIERLEQLILI
jgi:hypothetical protein